MLVLHREIERYSTISNEEFVQLVATFHAAGEPEQDFSRYTPKQIEEMQKSLKANAFKSVGLLFTKPLRSFRHPSFAYLSQLFSAFNQHGTLPFEGSLSDQPNHVIDIFNVFKALLAEHEAKERKKLEKNNRGR